VKKRTRIFIGFLSFSLVFAVIFLCLEFSYRAYKHYKYNKDIKNPAYPLITPLGPQDRLEYILKPNSEYTLKNGITYKINQKGLRDIDFSYEKPVGVRRILALGDSYTFGWKEGLEDAYPKQLESVLNGTSSQKYEVINAGVYGYNTEQEYEFLKRELIKYHPDLVVLGFVVNDAEPQNIMTRSPYLEMEGVRFWSIEFIKFRVNLLLQKFGIYNFFTLKQKWYHHNYWLAFNEKGYSWKKENCFKALKNINNLLDANNMPLVVVIFPCLEYNLPKPGEKHVYKGVIDSVSAFCREEGIEVINLYPHFEGIRTADIRQGPGGHLNRKGYSIAVKAISDYMATR